MSNHRILCLGAGEGWHASELRRASGRLGCDFHPSSYESLQATVETDGLGMRCEAGEMKDFDVVLARTMPAGSLEQITFRLAMMHESQHRAAEPCRAGSGLGAAARWSAKDRGSSEPVVSVETSGQMGFFPPVVNNPRSLELAIDKFATLSRVSQLGYPVPETHVAQNRSDAMEAFESMGGDCVVKPIFGGEGRGVMRLRDSELAWYAFSALDQLSAVFYVQRFVPPGGRDIRYLVIGEEVIAIRRRNDSDFRTNVSGGAVSERIGVDLAQHEMATVICRSLGLTYAAVDMLEGERDEGCVIEVNAIPGWKGAQRVVEEPIAEKIVGLLKSAAQNSNVGAR